MSIRRKNLATIQISDRYLSFPSVVCLNNSDLLMAFRSGRNCYTDFPEAIHNGKYHPHTDPKSEPWLARSCDHGRTWSIDPLPRSREQMDADHEDGVGYQDVGLTVQDDGRVLMTVFRWKYSDQPPTQELATPVREEGISASETTSNNHDYSRYQPFRYAYCLPPIYTISDQQGRNWSPFRSINVPEPHTRKQWGIATRNGGIPLDTDTIAVPFYCSGDGTLHQSGCFILKYHIRRNEWSFGSSLAINTDQLMFEEPLLHRIADGTLLGFLRTTTPGYMYATASQDNGTTWSTPAKTNIWGHPFAALTTANNDILLAYGYRREPFGIRISRLVNGDWNRFSQANEIVIRDDATDDDIGYPSMCFTSDSSIVLTYYFRGVEDNSPTRYIAIERLSN